MKAQMSRCSIAGSKLLQEFLFVTMYYLCHSGEAVRPTKVKGSDGRKCSANCRQTEQVICPKYIFSL